MTLKPMETYEKVETGWVVSGRDFSRAELCAASSEVGKSKAGKGTSSTRADKAATDRAFRR